MKKLVITLCALMLVVTLIGCGKKDDSPKLGALDSIKGMKEAADLGKALQGGDEKDATKAIENLAKLGADLEVKELENTEKIDVPSDFPSSLVYSGGKVVGASDNSYENTKDLDITIKTTDEISNVRDFYKKVLAENGWKITGQETSATNTTYNGKNEGEKSTVNVNISTNSYSKIIEIDVSFYDEA
jgi:hypothetical protein